MDRATGDRGPTATIGGQRSRRRPRSGGRASPRKRARSPSGRPSPPFISESPNRFADHAVARSRGSCSSAHHYERAGSRAATGTRAAPRPDGELRAVYTKGRLVPRGAIALAVSSSWSARTSRVHRIDGSPGDSRRRADLRNPSLRSRPRATRGVDLVALTSDRDPARRRAAPRLSAFARSKRGAGCCARLEPSDSRVDPLNRAPAP